MMNPVLRTIPAVALAAAVALGGDSLAEQNPAPVEQRANQLFLVLREADGPALRTFIEGTLHPSFLDLGPTETHMEQFAGMRATLGRFEIEGIRLMGPDRGDFILRCAGGERFVLHLEVEPIEPYRIAGLGMEEYRPIRDVPEYGSLEEAEAHLRSLEKANEFSGVVLVSRKGHDDWVRAYGMADKAKGIANGPETRFDVGSITKVLTAVAIMQLVERNLVALDAPMSRYLEGFPLAIAERVTVIDLLRMRSGYGDYFVPAFLDRLDELETVSDYLELFKTFELEFEPDTNQRYSNVGYVILGGIIEKASGMSYHDYVRKHIFGPAGMKDSSFRGLDGGDPRSAIGYTNDGPAGKKGFVETNRALLERHASPAGGSFSTAADLLRFNRALRGNELLDERGTTLLLNAFEDRSDRPATRGVAGGAPGVSAVDLEDADRGLTVIVLSNYDEPLAELIGQQIFRTLGGMRDLPTGKPVVAPMTIIGSQPAIEVFVAGQGPFVFLMDTGAGGAGRISRELAHRLGLEVVGQVRAGDPSGQNAETRDLVRAPALTIEGRTWHDVDLLLAGDGPIDPGVDGILGFQLFTDDLLTLDYPALELRLAVGELPPADGREILDFRASHGVPSIDIDVAGRVVAADIDSGSMGWLMVPESVAGDLPLAAEPEVVGKARTPFNEFEIKTARLDGVVKVGVHTLENPRLEFAAIFESGNIGGQLLRLFEVTFDQRNRRVRFRRAAEGAIVPEARYRVGVMLDAGDERLAVQGVVPASPASRAGLAIGDRVLALNGTPVADLPAGAMTRLFGSPEEIVLLIDRGGKRVELRMTPELAP